MANGEDQTILQPQFPVFSNYIVGLSLSCCGAGNQMEFRNFFMFQIPENIGSISQATLHIYNPTFGNNTPDPSETVTFYDVTSPLAPLLPGGAGLQAYYEDFGDGDVYGVTTVSSRDLGKYIDVVLSQDALSDLLSARGGMWAIGGRMTTIQPNVTQTVFGNTPDFSRPYLTLDVTFVPEPCSAMLWLFGMLCSAARRRNARAVGRWS